MTTRNRTTRHALLLSLVAAVFFTSPAASAAPPSPASPSLLGITYSGWRGGFLQYAEKLATFKRVGFPLVSFVPSYSYVDRNKIDLASAPTADELGAAIEAALRAGFAVVLKPHLNPPAFQPGFDSFGGDNHSWRAQCPWRGFFDIDPMSADYRDGVIVASLRMLKDVLDRVGQPAPPVRFELGVELMDSVVAFPERWEALLAVARQEARRLGLGPRVVLSHNFSHHIELPGDELDRMSRAGQRALARYIKGLDAVALSQYMDLTVAVPAAERGTRLPTADEVAEALLRHEGDFRRDILGKRLGLNERAIPPLHIGEFGVGRGGLKHPNLWSGAATPAQEQELARQIARGHEGLVRYLSAAFDGRRTARSAVLWVTGAHYDIFGWMSPAYAVPAAAAAIEAGLARRP
jgi:hypothetical protein